jgi:hypothetical protein
MGFLKSVGSIFPTSGLGLLGGSGSPKYNALASMLSQEQGVESDLGSVEVVPTGLFSSKKVYKSSEIDKLRNALAKEGLQNVTLDPQREEQAYYNRATRLLNENYDRQLRNADEALINRGIQTGTKQYNQVMGDIQNNQLGALSDLANQAIFAGQGYTSGQIGNVNALTGARDIYHLQGMGGSNGAYDRSYEAQQYNYNTQQNMLNNLLGAGASIGAAALLASDKRLKENLKPVGKLDNGLKVYVGNYKEETGLDTTPQLFLLAQEVEKKNPEAVGEKNGYLAVNYRKATENK